MAFKISSAFQTHQLVTGSLLAALDGNVIRIYGSAASQAAANALIPAEADDTIDTALLLVTISVNGAGTGISFEATPVDGALYKTSSETWTGTIEASGYASFYRLGASADVDDATTTDIRAQGTVGTLGKDLLIASAYLTLGDDQRIDNYAVGQPSE